MSLRRAPTSSRTQEARQQAIEAKPWSRRGWPREQLRSHWPHLTLQQVELLKEVFQHLFDTEDKGYFTRDELFFVMEAMGRPTAQELDQVMVELDSNGDSLVDFPEFLTKFLTATDEQELLSVFHQLAIQEGDGDDDRVVTLTAVERSFQFVGEPLSDDDKRHLEEIFKRADRDGNGRLDIKEFTAHLEKMDDELFMGQAGLGGIGGLLAAANMGAAAAAAAAAAGGGGGGGGGSVAGFAGFKGPSFAQQRSGRGDGVVDGGLDLGAEPAEGGGGGGAGAGAGGLLGGGSWAALRALSGRGGPAEMDVESPTSNQGGLRHSLLSKLGIGRQRRASVNSASIAALTEKLASLGYATNGCVMRVGSVSSANGFMRAQSLLHQVGDTGAGGGGGGPLGSRMFPHDDGLGMGVGVGGEVGMGVQKSASSARLPRFSHFGSAGQFGGGAAAAAAADAGRNASTAAQLGFPMGPRGGAEVDASSVSVMRLVSSMSQLGGGAFGLGPGGLEQGARGGGGGAAAGNGNGGGGGGGGSSGVQAAPRMPATVFRSSLSRSRAGTLADGLVRPGSYSGTEVVPGLPGGAWGAPGPGPSTAPIAGSSVGGRQGLGGGVVGPDLYPASRSGGVRVGSSVDGVNGTSRDQPSSPYQGGALSPASSLQHHQTHYPGQPFLPHSQHPQQSPPLSHLNPHSPHGGYPSPRSQTLSSSGHSPQPTPTGAGSASGVSPMTPPYGSVRDFTDEENTPYNTAAISPLSPAGALGPLPSLDRAAVNMSYAARVSAGLRPPTPTWRQPNVIQEALEEGDSGYSGTGMAVATTAPAPPPPMLTSCMSSRLPDHRTSAPTRFSRLRSFPDRQPQPLVSGPGAITDGAGSGGPPARPYPLTRGGSLAGASSSATAAAAAAAVADGVAGGRGLGPFRTGSGGEGRRGPRFGGLMAAVFSRQRSMGLGSSAPGSASPSPLGPRGADAAGSVSGAPPDGARRPTQSEAQVSGLPSTSSSPRLSMDTASAAGGGGVEVAAAPRPEDSEPPAKASSGGSWSLAAGALAAVGWLRRASSMSSGAGTAAVPPPPSRSASKAGRGAAGQASGQGRGGGGGGSGLQGGVPPPPPTVSTGRTASASAGVAPGSPAMSRVSATASTGRRSIGSHASLRIEVPGGGAASVSGPPSPALSAGGGSGVGPSPFQTRAVSAVAAAAAAAAGSSGSYLAAGGSGGSGGPWPSGLGSGRGPSLGALDSGAGDVRVSPSSPSRLPQPSFYHPAPARTMSASGTPAWPAPPSLQLRPPEPAAASAAGPGGGPASSSGWSTSASGLPMAPSDSWGPAAHAPRLGPAAAAAAAAAAARGMGPRMLKRCGSTGGGNSRLSISSSPRGSSPVVPSHIQRQASMHFHHHPPHRLSQQGSPSALSLSNLPAAQHLYYGPGAGPLQPQHGQSQPLLPRPGWEVASSPHLGGSTEAENEQGLALTEVASADGSGSWAGSAGSFGGGRASGAGMSPARIRTADRPVGPAWTPGRNVQGPGIGGRGLPSSTAVAAAVEEAPARRVFHRWHSHNPSHSSQLSREYTPSREYQQQQQQQQQQDQDQTGATQGQGQQSQQELDSQERPSSRAGPFREVSLRERLSQEKDEQQEQQEQQQEEQGQERPSHDGRPSQEPPSQEERTSPGGRTSAAAAGGGGARGDGGRTSLGRPPRPPPPPGHQHGQQQQQQPPYPAPRSSQLDPGEGASDREGSRVGPTPGPGPGPEGDPPAWLGGRDRTGSSPAVPGQRVLEGEGGGFRGEARGERWASGGVGGAAGAGGRAEEPGGGGGGGVPNLYDELCGHPAATSRSYPVTDVSASPGGSLCGGTDPYACPDSRSGSVVFEPPGLQQPMRRGSQSGRPQDAAVGGAAGGPWAAAPPPPPPLPPPAAVLGSVSHGSGLPPAYTMRSPWRLAGRSRLGGSGEAVFGSTAGSVVVSEAVLASAADSEATSDADREVGE